MRPEGLGILLVAAPIDGQMARRAAIHLHHAREVHIVHDVRRHDLADRQRRRHEVEQRGVPEVVLDEARLDRFHDAGKAIALEVEPIELLLQPGRFGRVLAELRLHRGTFRLDLLHFQVQLVQSLSLGLDRLLELADSFGIRLALDLEGVAIDVVGGLLELRRLVRPEEPRVDIRELVVEFVYPLAAGLHRLLRRPQLLLEPRQLPFIDAAVGLGELRPRDFELQLGELALRVLPLSIEIVPDHPDCGQKQEDARRREDDVQEVDVVGVPDSLFFSHIVSDIEEDLGNRHDVLQVEHPPKQHLDRQRHHHQEEKHGDVKPWSAQLDEIALEHCPREHHR